MAVGTSSNLFSHMSGVKQIYPSISAVCYFSIRKKGENATDRLADRDRGENACQNDRVVMPSGRVTFRFSVPFDARALRASARHQDVKLSGDSFDAIAHVTTPTPFSPCYSDIHAVRRDQRLSQHQLNCEYHAAMHISFGQP